MKRRAFIGTAGAAALAPATAGCTALLGASTCEPAADRLGDIDASRPVETTDREYRFRGTVVGYVDEGVLLDDGTGKAELVPGASKQRINRDLVKVGHCVEGRGDLNRERTRTHGMVVLTVDRADFEDVGSAETDIEPVGDYPEPEFGVGHPNGGVKITVVDGAGVTAGNVVVAYGEQSHFWPDLDESTGPDDPLRKGASVVVEDPPGKWVTIQWRSPDRTWGHRIGEARV